MTTYIKLYYKYFNNINNYRFGIKDAPSKVKANYKTERVEDFIEGTLYRLIVKYEYIPIIMKEEHQYANYNSPLKIDTVYYKIKGVLDFDKDESQI